MVLLDLFDTAIDSQTMTLVNHIIAHGQLRKTADLFAFVIVFLAFFLAFFCAKHITFRDHNELDQRVLKTFVKLSVCDQDLSLFNRSARIIRTKCTEIIFSQISCQTAGSRSGGRKEHHAVTILFPASQIFDQHLKTALV